MTGPRRKSVIIGELAIREFLGIPGDVEIASISSSSDPVYVRVTVTSPNYSPLEFFGVESPIVRSLND